MYCHYYQTTGKCKRGSTCTFKHKDPVTYVCLNHTCAICGSGADKKEKVEVAPPVKKVEEGKKNYKEKKHHGKEKLAKMEVEEEVYVAPLMPSEEQEKLIEIKKKEDAVYQGIADNKTKLFSKRIMEAYQDLQLFKPL